MGQEDPATIRDKEWQYDNHFDAKRKVQFLE